MAMAGAGVAGGPGPSRPRRRAPGPGGWPAPEARAAGAAQAGSLPAAAAAAPPPAALPEGTVAFLFTDLEGSTRLLQAHPAAYRDAVRRHHALLRGAVEAHGGVVFETLGDAVCAAFGRPTDAVAAALAGQVALHREDWGAVGPLRARMGVHLGDVERQGAHYFGAPLYRCGRLMDAAHGGQTVLSGAAVALVRDALPEGAGLRDLGAHWLKDLPRPERVFQLTAPGLPGDFPALRTPCARPHNLPAPLTSFVGRERELGEVAALLGAHRLVTLTGPGGVGKTRLALEVAAAAGGDFAHGAWFVALAPLADPRRVAAAVAQALGVRERGGEPLVETLKGALRVQEVLLVLDNVEHLLAAAPLAAELLAAAPGLRVLATSRAPLRVSGEREYPVPPLALPVPPGPSGRLDPEALARSEAGALFVQRARGVQPGFRVTAENAAALAAICARLDGLPLAIELAAALVRLLPPPALLARLEATGGLPLLVGGPRDAPARQRTLRAAIAWSYDLLTAPERALFRLLAICRGGFTLEAAEALWRGAGRGAGGAGGEALDLLASLVEKSLVRCEAAAPAAARFALAETIGAFAREHLVAGGEAAAAARAHAEYFVGFAGEHDLEHGPRAPRWIDTVEQELVNFRTALDWLERHRRYGDALRLAARLAPVWSNRGYIGEGSATLRRLLGRPETAAPTHHRAFCLWYAGIFARYSGDLERARATVEEMLAVARAVGDQLNVAYATLDLGWVAHEQGSFLVAQTHYEAALAAFRAQGYVVGVSLALDQLAKVAAATGDQEAARRLQSESLVIRRRIGHRWGVGSSLVHLGDLALRRNDFGAAIDHYGECLQAVRPMGTPIHLTAALEGVAAVAASLRHSEQALRLLGAATALRETSGAGADRDALLRHRLIQLRAAGPLPPEERLRAETEGRNLTLDEAIADALALPPAAGGAPRPAGGEAHT
jgi:predicted ATPase/class 3 adenylate cyclase